MRLARRATAIMYLDRCGTCRECIRDLAITEEELLGLLPGSNQMGK
jgi:hypothetical protein